MISLAYSVSKMLQD
jgi:P-type Ca2+ transporter type 2B